MIEQLPEKEDKFEAIKEHKFAIIGGVVLFLVVISFILLISGRQDCEIVSLKEGVVQTCHCKGMVVTVKSISNSGERKTVCIGVPADKVRYSR